MARKKRSSGEGTVFFWEEKGLWVSRITLPNGKKRTKYSKKQSVVKDWLLENRNQLKQGMLPGDATITVGQFMANYMESVGKQTLRPRTQEMYNGYLINHIVPSLGR